MAGTVLADLDAEFWWLLTCFWLSRIWGQSAPSTNLVPEKMRVVVGGSFLQTIAVSTGHNSVGDALGRRVDSRGGCVWCQLGNEHISEVGMLEFFYPFKPWASWSYMA